jgi:hypothetical protein
MLLSFPCSLVAQPLHGFVERKVFTVGAWQVTVFGNDVAMDFVFHLQHSDNVEASLTDALDISRLGYIDDDIGSRALVAAEIIATARSGAAGDLPVTAQQVVARLRRPISPQHVANARAAVERIAQSCETKELRQELGGQGFADWKHEVENMINRLQE